MEKRIIKKAKTFGVPLAGVASLEQVLDAPSHETTGIPPKDYFREFKSVVVLALPHPKDEPLLDCWDWDKRKSPGDDLLKAVCGDLSQWLKGLGVKSLMPAYQIENGGLFLKDAAVMAGLGCIGKNNLLVTPEFGPRVRFRALVADLPLASTGPLDFNPCLGCKAPCRLACPQKAFDREKSPFANSRARWLPATDGEYARNMCIMRLEKNRETGKEGAIRYCRLCEFACPVGK